MSLPRHARTASRAVAAAALAGVVALPRAAHADPPPPRRAPDERDAGEVIVTARRVPEWQHRSDRAVYTVTAEQLAQRQPRSIPEALQDTPGVSAQMTNRGAGAPVLRGLVGPRNLLLFDGIRLNQSTWRNGPLQYLALVDPWAVEQIEVQLGPGSVVHGSDAMGGVVYMLPVAPPRAGAAPFGARARLRGWTADGGLEAAADLAARAGPVSARAAGSFRSFGLLRAGGGAVLPFTDYRAFGARAQAWYAPSPAVTIGAAYLLGGVLGAGRTDLLGTGRLTRFDNVDHLAYVDLRVRPGGGGASVLRELRAAVSLRATDDRATQVDCDATDGLVRDAGACLAGERAAVRRRRVVGDTVVTPGVLATALLVPPGARARVVLGGDGYWDFVGSGRTTFARDAGYAASAPERGNFSDGSRAATLGLFAHAELDALPAGAGARERLVVAGGARLAGFVTHATGVPVAGTVSAAQAGAVGSASVRYVHADDLTAYASWAQGFRAPNLQESTQLGVEGGAYLVPPARALAPERSNSFELGLRVRSGPVQLAVAGYVTLLSDMLVREDVARDVWTALAGIDPREVGALRVQRVTNAAAGRYVGGEAQVRVALAPGLTAWAHASMVHGEVREANGQQQPTQKTPPPLGAFGLRYVRAGFYVEALARWALPQDRLNAVDRSDLRVCEDRARPGTLQTNCTGTPGWITVGLRGGYRFGRALRLDLAVENLTDARYRYHSSGVDEPGLSAIASVTGEL